MLTAVVPGTPMDPVLGLPRAVIHQKLRQYWFEFLFGLAFLLGDLSVIAGIHTETWTAGGAFGAIAFGIFSPFLIFDGFRNIRRRPCLIVAANGFDDRTGWRPVGPVLWREVAGMEQQTQNNLRYSYPKLVITLKAGGRRPLSPLGKLPRQVSEITIPMEQGNDKLMLPAMYSSYQEWLQAWENAPEVGETTSF